MNYFKFELKAALFSDLSESTVMAAVIIRVQLHGVYIKQSTEGLDDFLNYAICTTREHQRTFKRMKDVNAWLEFLLKDFSAGFWWGLKLTKLDISKQMGVCISSL